MLTKRLKSFLLLAIILITICGVQAISATDTDNATDTTSIVEDTTPSTNQEVQESVKTIADNKINKKATQNVKTQNTLIINDDNVDDVFNGEGYTIGDSVTEGDVLDFQGTIDKNHSLVINKAINIISSTQDAVISLHTRAGSYFGEDPGNAFVINKGGSNSNITGLYLTNTQLWVYNTANVLLKNMSMVVKDERVGSGVGQTALRYSSNITMDGCLISTENNGGSSSFVWTATVNSTLINSKVEGIGNVGNLIYVGNLFNVADAPEGFVVAGANVNNVVKNCTITGAGSAISVPLQNGGANTLVEGNKFYVQSSAVSTGTTGTAINNEFYNAVGLTVTANSVAYGNVFYGNGSLTAQANSKVYNNTLHNVSISGAGVLFENNTVKSRVTATQPVNIANNNLNDVQLNTGAKASNITNNNITGTVTSQAQDVTIKNNNITSSNDYTIVVTGANNQIQDNYLVTNVKAGEESISTTQASTIIGGNTPESGKTYEITDETYSQFFDEDGKLLPSKANDYDTLTLKGPFNDKIFDIDSIRVTLQGQNATINNGYFKSSDKAAVLVQNLVINNTKDTEHSVIFESDSNTLRNVTIYRNSDDGISQEVLITGDKNLIDSNTFELNVATQPVAFDQTPSLSKVSAITILSSNNNIQKNKIRATTTKNNYGTINIIDLASTDKADQNTITQNVIEVTGTDYTYGINIGINTNKNTITNNNITLTSDTYADAIQIMNGPSTDNTINTNNINITAPSAYGILITAWEKPEVSGNTFNSNKINVTGNQAYAFQLTSSNPAIIIKDTTISSNTIKSEGNYSVAIAFMGKDSTISLNTITVTGTTNQTNPNSYDAIPATTAGIILKNSDNINNYNNTINTTNGANFILENTNNSKIISTTSTATRYINAEDNTNIILKQSNNNIINAQRAYTTGTYTVELEQSSQNTITGNILNASNILGGDNAVKADSESKDNTIYNNTPTIALLTDETYPVLFDENGVYTYPEGIDILSLAGDLHNKDLTFINNLTFSNSRNYTIYNGTININENGTQQYTNRFVYIRDININNTDKPALIDNLETTQQRNINYYGGSITITSKDDVTAIQSVKDHNTYAIIDIENAVITLEGKNVILAKMTRPTLSQQDYIDIEKNNINIKSTEKNYVIYDEYVNLDLLGNNITQTGKEALTVYADNGYANGKFFGENNINITADKAGALLLINGRASNPNAGNNNITITSPNPVTAINMTSTTAAYVGLGQYTSYNYPNIIIVNADNGEVPVVTVTTNGYVRNNYILANDVWGQDAVEANTKSNNTPNSRTNTSLTAPDTVKVGEEFEITAKAVDTENNPVTGTYTLTINDEEITKVTGTELKYKYTATKEGTLEIKVEYTDSTNKNAPSSNTTRTTAGRTNTTITVETNKPYLNEDLTIKGTLTDENNKALADKTITITVNNETLTTTTNTEGNYQVTTTPQEGNNTITATFDGGEEYITSTESTNVQVIDIEKYNKIDELEKQLEEQQKTIDEQQDKIEEQQDKIDEQQKQLDDKQKQIDEQQKQINELNEKLAQLQKQLEEKQKELQDKINELTKPKTTTITLDPINDAKFNSQVTIKGLLYNEDGISLTSQTVTLTVNGKNVDVKTVNGIFEYNTTYTSLGEQTVTAVYADNTKYVGSTDTIKFNVAKQDIIFNVDPVDSVAFGDNVTITGSVSDASGNILYNTNIVVKVNGKAFAVKTDKEGKFSLNAVLNALENKVIVTYGGNTYYNQATQEFTVNAEKQDINIKVDAIKQAAFGDSVTITGTVTDANGNIIYNTNIVIKVNGKVYTAKTDKNGKFSVSVQATNLGTNNVEVSYGGNNYYNSASTTATFTAGKQDLVATVDTVKLSGKTGTVTGTLKDKNGNALYNTNVVVTVNGKAATATTNKTGEFTLSSDYVVAGSNNITVAYGGNNYYNKVTITKTLNA